MDLGYQNPFYLKQAQQKQQSFYNGKVLLDKHDPPVVYDLEETLQLSQEKAAKFVGDFKSFAKETDESLDKIKVLEYDNDRILRAVVSQDIMSIVQNNSIVDNSNLETELERVESTAKTRRPQPNPKNNRITSTSKSSCLSNNLEKVEEHHRNFLVSNTPNHKSSACNNIKLVVRNDKFKVVCGTCKQCLSNANHDECVFKHVNDMNSNKQNQSANASECKSNKHKAHVKKSKKLGSKERLASPRPSKPSTFLRWLPTGRIFDLSGTITESSNTESETNTFVYDNASASNPQEPTSKSQNRWDLPGDTPIVRLEFLRWQSAPASVLGLKRLQGFLEVTTAQVHNGNYAKYTAGTKVYAAGLQLLEDLLLSRG
ncbi:hypothetical protein Tco_0864638 [Tanacetum coccineum]